MKGAPALKGSLTGSSMAVCEKQDGERGAMVVAKYGDKGRFLQTFNPDMQGRYVAHLERCFFGSAPTLQAVDNAYGTGVSQAWLVVQLYNLSEYCGCREKLTEMQLRELASVMRQQYSFLKVTEFMVFFQQFKAGVFGRFYGSVDPMVITEAVRTFMAHRGAIIAKREEALRREALAAEMQGAVSREEYEAMRQRGEV